VICTECKHPLAEAGHTKTLETRDLRRDEYTCVTCGAKYRVSIFMLQRSTLSPAQLDRMTNRNT
jgi:hypothetical protein